MGENLHDRYEVSVVNELDADFPIFDDSTLDLPAPGEPDDHLLREWKDDRGGPYSTNGSLAAMVAHTSAGDGDNADVIIFSLAADFHGYYPHHSYDAKPHHDRMSMLVLKGWTRDRAGSVRLRSADPRDVPDIRMRYFDEGSPGWERDLDGVVDGLEMARTIVGSIENTKVVRELVPGAEVASREELREFVKREAWGHHACGTAKIGTDDDPMAVLDGDLRVRGVEGLRVVDASVFPDIPGFFIASAVYMVSEKASDQIIAEYRDR